MNMKIKTTISAVAVALILSGCSAGQGASFDSTVKLTAAPTWDLSGHVKDIENAYASTQSTAAVTPPPEALESAKKLVEKENLPTPKQPAGDPSPESTVPPTTSPEVQANVSPTNGNIYSDSYIANFDTKTSCKITGQISYLESYKATWGEEYNSKGYLFNLIDPSEKTLSNQKKVDVNGTSFIYGTYTQPLSYGERPYHVSAARAFNTVLTMPDATNSGVGPYQSKTNEGIPFVFIDMSCVDEKEATQENWDRLTDIFHLSYVTKK